jgi:hypothetical protein
MLRGEICAHRSQIQTYLLSKSQGVEYLLERPLSRMLLWACPAARGLIHHRDRMRQDELPVDPASNAAGRKLVSKDALFNPF